jgi:hypothetical protein
VNAQELRAAMDFMNRYAMKPQPRVRIRPETLERCHRMVGTTAYMRWYLRAASGDLHT